MIDDGVDSKAGGGVDVQFAGDMFAVRDYRVRGYVQHVGNFLVT